MPALKYSSPGRHETVMGDCDVRSCYPLYRRVLGDDAWEKLSEKLKTIHGGNRETVTCGRARVTRGAGWFANVVAWMIGFPRTADDVDVTVSFSRSQSGETWRRRFGEEGFESWQFEGVGRDAGLICERFGPLVFGMAPVVDGGRLILIVRKWSFNWNFLRIPLPGYFVPTGDILEYEKDGRFHFHVEIVVPLLGLLVRYQGYLVPVSVARR